jgi:hypothetical protein
MLLSGSPYPNRTTRDTITGMFAILATAVALAQPAPPAAWAFDTLRLTNGSAFRGLLLADGPAVVKFQVVTRAPGRPTVTLTTEFPRADVERIERLGEAERATLRARLAELDPTGKGERDRMASLTLTPAPWLDKPDGARRYASDDFTLVSTAPEDLTRRAAVRLEQLAAAFRRFLPPRAERPNPTAVFLAPTPAEFRALLGPGAPRIVNPAVYDVAGNRIVCGSDLQRLGSELTGSMLHHERQRIVIDQYEADVRKLYKDNKPDLERFLATCREQRQRIALAEAANDRAFDGATKRLFAVLSHELFHAYAANTAFPDGGLPRWLNEGLAQLFETAVVEAGELRLGHADPARLRTVREFLKPGGPGLTPMAELLRADAKGFLVTHTDATAASDRAYATAWLAAHDLLFRHNGLASAKFDTFRDAAKAGGDPARAFAAWTGLSPGEYDVRLREYAAGLQNDGSFRASK